jgi:hypothetical protein
MTNIQFPALAFPPGTFNAQLLDNNGNPSTVLEASLPITITATWDIDKEAARLLGGAWNIAAYADTVGPGTDLELGETTVAVDGGTSYSATITVPPNKVADNPPPPASGAYKVVVVLTHRNFGQISDVAAVVEFPVVRIG